MAKQFQQPRGGKQECHPERQGKEQGDQNAVIGRHGAFSQLTLTHSSCHLCLNGCGETSDQGDGNKIGVAAGTYGRQSVVSQWPDQGSIHQAHHALGEHGQHDWATEVENSGKSLFQVNSTVTISQTVDDETILSHEK